MAERRAPGSGLVASWLQLGLRRWRAGTLVFLAVAAAVAAVLLLSDPVYRADARLRLGEPPPSTGVSPTSGFIGLLQQLGGDPFANDLELLRSRTVAEQVVDDVALHARLDAPRHWHRDSLFVHFHADRTTVRARYELEHNGEGAVRVRMVSPRDSAVAEGLAGEPISFGGVHVTLRRWRPGAPTRFHIVTEPFDDIVRRLSGRLRVERTRREANVLDLAFEDTDPAVSLAAVAAALEHFMALRTAIQLRESGETVDSLRAVAAGTKAELRAAEEALEAWQRDTRLVAPEPQGEAFVERYAALLTDLETVRIEGAAIDSILVRLAAEQEPSRAWVTLLAYPRFFESETVGALLARMSELEELRLELAARRAETSREYGVLRDQIAALDGSLRRLAVGLRASLRERTVDLEAIIAGMDRELARMPGDAVELMRRQRDVRVFSELTVLTEQRLRQEELRQALTYANVQMIDAPQLRRRQVWPRPKLGAAIGLLLAGGFGLLGMVAAERADPSVRSARMIRELTGAPVVATITLLRRGLEVAPADAAALAGLAARQGAATLSIAPVSGEDAAVVAGVLETSARQAGVDLPALRVTPPVTSFAAAAGAARDPVLLVAEQGRSRARDVHAAAERVREAGGAVLGTVALCRGPRAAREMWG